MFRNKNELLNEIETMKTSIQCNKENQELIVKRMMEEIVREDRTVNEKINMIINAAHMLETHIKNYHRIDDKLMLMTDVMSVMNKEGE